MTKVRFSGYIVPFHHLPPVSRKALKFPSYALGYAKTQALQEAGKMLQKGALRLVDRLGYYSRLFLVQKAPG